ncbi:hypothetical protein [Cellulosilyticum sp. I15G10I2]|uniref:hypothetical protein n=1 Tax=Cellulosilyticum sp. I15G10I2 TaxID=1892843 RepID=UPI00085BC04C|nr:hypothetical protein [Cellulosilyticum sp. I15G10I2]
MRRNKNTTYTDEVFIKGCVCYEDLEPVKNAIVILEQILLMKPSCAFNVEHEVIYSTYTTTNRHGEFCFLIGDRNKYYKIKVFDTHYNDNGRHTSNMTICL